MLAFFDSAMRARMSGLVWIFMLLAVPLYADNDTSTEPPVADTATESKEPEGEKLYPRENNFDVIATECLTNILDQVQENPLSELQRREEDFKPVEEVVVEDVVDEKRIQGEKIAREMQKNRYEQARLELYVELTRRCRNCTTSRCYKSTYSTHYNSTYHRYETQTRCSHRLSGEIEELNSDSKEKLSVVYGLPAGMNRLVKLNKSHAEYNRQRKQLIKSYRALEKRLHKLGYKYEDFGLKDKADTARVIPPDRG